jgi:hypothetical protein
LIFLPQAVHFAFSKNCNAPQRGLVQWIISPEPHFSHRSSAKVGWRQVGHTTVSERPHPAQTGGPF